MQFIVVMQEEMSERQGALEREIAGRLKPMCEGWPDALFASLVQRVCATALKYDYQSTEVMPEPQLTQLTQLMVAEMKEMADRSAEIREQLAAPPMASPPPPPSAPLP